MNPWWQEVVDTLEAEFSDLTDASELTRITVRLVIAAVLGGVLGFEREHQGKAAGMRTHMLVAMGAALFVQGIVAGIGFLGAGTILKGSGHDTSHVKGLTTAAGLWMTAAIGTAAGMGREATAVLSTLLALGILSLMPSLVERIVPIKKKPQDQEQP
jgi:putative Mg2+ transporter-C (MgtC) family protein